MATLAQRFLAGAHEAVWAEFGAGLPLPVTREEAEAIARAIMRRVRYNLKLLIQRLVAAGYPFENPLAPEGDGVEARYHAVLAPPLASTRATLDEVERLVGVLPLSVRAWYEQVGAVNCRSGAFQAQGAGAFQGAESRALGPDDDPLMVLPAEDCCPSELTRDVSYCP